MAKSNIRIKKICEWCGQEFVAQKVTTKYCSHKCANLAYKQAIRAKRIQQEEQRIQIVKSEKPLMDIKDKEYLSIAQAATLLGLSLQAVYKMIYTGRLVAYKLSSRLSFVRQSDIEEMLKRNPYKKRQPKDTLPITDFYTTNEIKEKFGVKDSWIFHIAKEHNIPRTFNRGKTYWSKKHIDDYFAKKAPNPEIKEWYSTQDMQEKFGMTLTAILSECITSIGLLCSNFQTIGVLCYRCCFFIRRQSIFRTIQTHRGTNKLPNSLENYLPNMTYNNGINIV